MVCRVGVAALRIISCNCLIRSRESQYFEYKFAGAGEIGKVELSCGVIQHTDRDIVEVNRGLHLKLAHHKRLVVIKIDPGEGQPELYHAYWSRSCRAIEH